MSEESAVRQVLRPSDQPHRSLEERLVVRMPSLVRLTAPSFSRLPPRSRLRRALMRRRIHQIYGAFNRRDLEVFVLLGNDPEVELHTARLSGEVAAFDLRDVYRGHSGLLEFVERWLEAWADLRVELEEVIDCGDRIVVLMRQHARGMGSGVEVEHPFAQAITLGTNGLAIRVDNFMDHAEALEAAGLSE